MLAQATPCSRVEWHVGKGFRRETRLPSLGVELLGVGPPLRVVLHHVLTKVNPDGPGVQNVGPKLSLIATSGEEIKLLAELQKTGNQDVSILIVLKMILSSDSFLT